MSIRFTSILLCIVAAIAAFGQLQAEPYKLGPEDVITLAVMRHPEWSGDLLVPPDGVVDLPVAGPTKVAGMTLVEVRKLVVSALAKRVLNPEATVLLKTPRIRRVYVAGIVKVPSAQDYKPGWRISEVLASCGGLVDNAQVIDTRVSVLRASSGKLEEVALSDVLTGSPEANLAVSPGDVVTFKSVETVPIYVVGQVGKPGVTPTRLDRTGLMAVIAQAGGFLPTASTANLTVTHVDGSVQKYDVSRVMLYGEKVNLPNLQSGDLVTVPELQARFAIAGLVKSPGLFPIPDGKEYRLSDALSLAGGHDTKRARLSRVAVLRNDNGKMKRMIINFGHFLDRGDATQNIVLRTGDVIYVPETNSIDWQQIFNGLVSTYYVVNATKI